MYKGYGALVLSADLFAIIEVVSRAKVCMYLDKVVGTGFTTNLCDYINPVEVLGIISLSILGSILLFYKKDS